MARSRLTPGAILEALREAVTIIEPGEALAVRVPPDVRDDERAALAGHSARIRAAPGVTVLLVRGEELGRLRGGDA